uniref:Protein kinase domain-containing protein n=1 Tax=Seriola dumerili TaxID=41447 RepID=A0A3B4VN41_SERDU
MGTAQSTLEKNGYVLQKETENAIIPNNAVVATKGDDTFLIKTIILQRVSDEMLNGKQSLPFCHQDEQDKICIVLDYCQGGNLAAKITDSSESEVHWIVEICMALKAIHEKGLLHKHLTPELYLCVCFFPHSLKNTKSTTNLEETTYLPPEVFTEGTYDEKGVILLQLCFLIIILLQFSAETTITLMPKVISGPCPSLPKKFPPELHQLLNDMFSRDPQSRPTASEILERPFIIRCLLNKTKTTMVELQTKLTMLRDVADDLERVHQGATIGSLAGGVIGAVGGITSIVGLILSPFTLGASLIVTGVGVGVSAVGGVTAGASNLKNMVNQSSDRKAVKSILQEFEQKIQAVVTWLQEIGNSLQNIRSRCGSADMHDTEDSQLNTDHLTRLGFRAGRGIGSIAELVRLVQVLNIGRIAAQASRAVRVAEVATGVLSGLFIAVDIFFIAMDAKEIHHIRQAQDAEGHAPSESVFETDDTMSTFDQAALLPSSVMQVHKSDTSQEQDQSSKDTTPVRSEIMRFVRSIREAANNLQTVLDELNHIISSIPSLEVQSDNEWKDMELM